MLLFLDTEFTDFHEPELISIGLVSECGRFEFYAERSDFDVSKCSDFVRQSVLPQFGDERLDRETLANRLRDWLERIRSLDGSVIVLHDFAMDFTLLKRMIDPVTPWLDGINISDDALCVSWLIEDESKLHHALHDARMLRQDWLANRYRTCR